MPIKNWKKEICTIPNLLSLFRLILIPVYIVIYLRAQDRYHYFLSGMILAVSCLTDMIDGKIARKFNMITDLGKLLDPLADKATQFALIICLAVKHPILRWLFGLFVLKEAFQTVACIVFLHKGKALNGALFSGKVCTTVLFVSLILMVLMPNLEDAIVNTLAITDGLFMCLALTDYATAYFCNRNKLEDWRPQPEQ